MDLYRFEILNDDFTVFHLNIPLYYNGKYQSIIQVLTDLGLVKKKSIKSKSEKHSRRIPKFEFEPIPEFKNMLDRYGYTNGQAITKMFRTTGLVLESCDAMYLKMNILKV